MYILYFEHRSLSSLPTSSSFFCLCCPPLVSFVHLDNLIFFSLLYSHMLLCSFMKSRTHTYCVCLSETDCTGLIWLLQLHPFSCTRQNFIVLYGWNNSTVKRHRIFLTQPSVVGCSGLFHCFAILWMVCTERWRIRQASVWLATEFVFSLLWQYA